VEASAAADIGKHALWHPEIPQGGRGRGGHTCHRGRPVRGSTCEALDSVLDDFEVKDDEYSTDPNTGYSIHGPSGARNHERPNHLRLFQDGWEPRSFRDRHEDAGHIGRVRDMERRNKQATQEFLPRWNEAEKEVREGRKKRTGTD
jgi:hypothetical protein